MKHIEKIVWRDIAGISAEDNCAAWMSKDQLVTQAEKLYDCEHVSVGVVVKETSRWIAVAATWDYDDTYADASMILKSVIVSRKKIGKA